MFSFFGQFYSLPNTTERFRRSLEITRVGTTGKNLDALVIMMNPGSSYPICDHNPKCPVPCKHESTDRLTGTRPDTTQHRITALMNLRTWDRVRVLNLSDVRATKDELKKINVPSLPDNHSIFSLSRAEELAAAVQAAPIVICAWGTNDKFSAYAELATEYLAARDIPIYGVADPANTTYYHPLYPNKMVGYWPTIMANMIP